MPRKVVDASPEAALTDGDIISFNSKGFSTCSKLEVFQTDQPFKGYGSHSGLGLPRQLSSSMLMCKESTGVYSEGSSGHW